MRSTCSAFLIATTLVGCGNKKQDDNKKPAGDKPAPGSSNSMAKSGGDDKPEPVAKSGGDNAGGGGGDEVRAPTADDLAAYTQDITGNGPLVATIDTSMGAFHCTLFPDKAPMTVANFVGLSTGKKAWTDPDGKTQKKPFFDGLIFHRVIPGFMIQGGDPLGQGVGGPGYNFGDEVNNGLTMKPGTLAMANAGPGTNGSQFFITEGAPAHLNNHHTIFGACKEVDLVKQIEGVPRDRGDKPDTPVTIKTVTFSKS